MYRPRTADSTTSSVRPLNHHSPAASIVSYPSYPSYPQMAYPPSPQSFSPDASTSTLVPSAYDDPNSLGNSAGSRRNQPHPLSKGFNASSPSLSLPVPILKRRATLKPSSSQTLPTPEPWSSLSLVFPSRERGQNWTPRQHHLDTLKFLAALLVANGTFFAAFLPIHPERPLSLMDGGALYSFVQPGLGATLLLTLTGRSLLVPLFTPSAADRAVGIYRPSFSLFTRAVLLRPARFVVPVFVTAVMQWAVADTASTAAANLNNSNFTAPQWGAIRNWAGLCTLLWGAFTWGEDNQPSMMAFGSNLWIAPWLFQASFFALVLFLVISPLPSTRYWIYLFLAPFLWSTNSFFLPTLLGALVADFDAHGLLASFSRLPMYATLPAQLALLALGLCIELIPGLRDPLNSGMAAWNVRSPAYDLIRFSDILFALLWLLAIDLSPTARQVLSLRPFRYVSRLTAGTVLLSPIIVYAALPPMNPSLAGGWALTLLLSLLLAAPFRLLMEVPSMVAAELVVDKMRIWGGDGMGDEQVAGEGWARLSDAGLGSAGENREMSELKGEKR